MAPHHLLLLAVATASPAVRQAPPTEVAVSAAGTVLARAVAGSTRDRFRLVPDQKGTVLISLDRIHGPAPLAILKNAEGQRLRRADRRGKLWARPAPGTELFLEVSAPARDQRSVYQLSVAFDVDRPREQRSERRPARPRDIVRVTASDVHGVDGVQVGGLPAEYTIQGGEVFVAVPAFARSGPIELHYESRPSEMIEVELIGVEPPREGLDSGACAARPAPGCLRLDVEPPVGSLWLGAIARVVDADVAKHDVRSGMVELKLRLPGSESYALELLRAMPGVRAAKSLSAAAR